MTELSTLPEYLPPEEVKSLIERMRSTGWADLNPRKRAFAISFASTGSHIQTANELNIDTQTALKYTRDAVTMAMVQDIQDSFLEINVISASYVRQKWLELLPKLMGEEDVSLVYRDAPFTGKKFHASETVALLKELSRSVENFYKDNPKEQTAQYNVHYYGEEPPKEDDDENSDG